MGARTVYCYALCVVKGAWLDVVRVEPFSPAGMAALEAHAFASFDVQSDVLLVAEVQEPATDVADFIKCMFEPPARPMRFARWVWLAGLGFRQRMRFRRVGSSAAVSQFVQGAA